MRSPGATRKRKETQKKTFALARVSCYFSAMTTESPPTPARRPTATPRTGRPKLPPKDAAKVLVALDVLYRRLGTHGAVGEAIGVSESAVGALRGERNQASLPTCAAISRALGLADASTPDGDARARLLVLTQAQIRGL